MSPSLYTRTLYEGDILNCITKHVNNYYESLIKEVKKKLYYCEKVWWVKLIFPVDFDFKDKLFLSILIDEIKISKDFIKIKYPKSK